MNVWNCAITLATCCCICLTGVQSASADFVGVTTVIKDDPDTAFLCTQGGGQNIPGPLTVCNVFVAFDNPIDRLRAVGFAELQVYNGQNPDVFFQHPFNALATSPMCSFVDVFLDLICDTFVSIGYECAPDPPGTDGTALDMVFDSEEYNANGHIIGGWWDASPDNGQGDAGNYPNLEVFILRSSVAEGLSLSGVLDVFWEDAAGDVIREKGIPVECAASCGACPTDSDGDGDTDAADLAMLLGNWGPVDAGECLDNDTSGQIDAFDLAVLLGAWGPCL